MRPVNAVEKGLSRGKRVNVKIVPEKDG